jgi:hypothetical protein
VFEETFEIRCRPSAIDGDPETASIAAFNAESP